MSSEPRSRGQGDTPPDPEDASQSGSRLLLILRWLLPLSMLLLMAFVVLRELRPLDPAAIHRAFQAIPLSDTLWLLLGGLIATALMSLYDGLLRRWFSFPLGLLPTLRYAWLAGVLNNVVGFAGMTGSGIRYLALTRAGVSAKKAVACTGLVILSMPVGLSLMAATVLLLQPHLPSLAGLPTSVGLLALGLIALYWPLFLLVAGRGPLHRRLLAETPTLHGLQRLALLGISLLDWLAAGVLLWACLRAAQVPISLEQALTSFTLAVTLGWISLVPGGLAVFEGAMLAQLGQSEADPSNLLAGLLLFRVAYYFVPFVFAARLLPGLRLLPEGGAIEEFIQRFQAHPILRFGRIPLQFLAQIGTRVLAYLTFAAGALLLISAAFPGVTERIRLLDPYLPLLAREGFHLSSVVAGTLLLGLARGIGAGMRRAYDATQVVLLSGALLSLLKGLAVEESVFLLTFSFLLRANRSSFDRRGYPLSSPRSLRWLLAAGITLLAVAWLGALLYEPREWLTHLSRFEPGLHAATFARALLAMALTFLAWLAWSWFSLPAPDLQLPDAQALQRARRFYTQVACTPYSFLSLMGDKHLLPSEDPPSLIQYGIKRHHLVALGDPACSVADLPRAIDGLRRFADSYNLTPVFYQVDEGHLHHYHEAGFRLLKLGESARVPLADFTLKGKVAEKLRSALNQGQRARLQFERLDQPLDEATWQRLEAISDTWLEDKQMAEIGFSLGSFDRSYLAQSPMAVVRQDGGIIAFASLNDDFGRGQECGIDLMRHLTDVPNGVMDFLFVNLLQQAQAEGYQWFDLGMAPLSGVGRSPWSPRDERLLKLVFEFGNRFYNYKGLRRYKEKFRPQWRGMYLAYPRGHALAPILLDVTALITGGYWRALRG